jgi:hypothetical protein
MFKIAFTLQTQNKCTQTALQNLPLRPKRDSPQAILTRQTRILGLPCHTSADLNTAISLQSQMDTGSGGEKCQTS